jgi:hypothetical protein
MPQKKTSNGTWILVFDFELFIGEREKKEELLLDRCNIGR